MSQQDLPYVEVNPTTPAKAAVIWLHGLGDSGNGFAPIVPELHIPEALAVRFIFPHAPIRPVTVNNGMEMRAWYDIKSMDFNSRADRAGVDESSALVQALIEQEIAQGIPANRIVLAGFSQGGVIALHLGTRIEQKLAGIMSLSSYMCEPESLSAEAHTANKHTPIFVAHGQQDDVVPMAMGNAAFNTLQSNGYPASWSEYAMQHNVCMQEINDISNWLQKVLA
ncbi:alpha/beta hydrolase fold domain-containing protein [Paraglaciecola aquimarina]|uniref:Alpha/beta hydrolase fold domain-containing protein n=1 Tax=Paraglaciecola aquimarina TaxID=1235557 RepID=A0ABU3SSH1_9ALTE|nr:alpha/beta hydrolase fold domain-containing protein [Paraglaciecola aquimarina]MDU0352935.1 alpha/beta hydrolase fold domain-containing protein [Paraglaciecola aquimarina]